MTIDHDTLTERRIALRDHILRAGPEHTAMSTWFDSSDLRSIDDFSHHELGWAATLDINACGTTACLAGHGALLMLPQTVNDPGEVAAHFDLDDAAFDTGTWWYVDLADDTSLGDERERHRRDGYPPAVANWRALIAYLDDLIKS